ncbi:MAG: glutathione S-transferase family protein [Cyanophyceae cyanobacterium]
MAIDLYQFELSAYCEKVRLALDAKGLAYRKVEVTPGVGQIEVFQKSGQRRVPVLVDGAEAIADSTAILHYLDRQYPDTSILPEDRRDRALCWLLEDWADSVLTPQAAKLVPLVWGGDAATRSALLPDGTPEPIKTLLGAVPQELFSALSTGVGGGPEALRTARQGVETALMFLVERLEDRPYLVGDRPTVADFAVAAGTLALKVPTGPYLDVPSGLRGRGVPGIADSALYAPFFEWRDRLYETVRTPVAPQGPPPSSGPTPIVIES